VGVQGRHTSDAGISPLRRWSFWRRVLAAFARLGVLVAVSLLLLMVPPCNRPPNAVRPAPEPRADNATSPAVQRDRGPLVQALRSGDDAALLAWFRGVPLSAKERGKVQSLVERLGNGSFATREEAARELLGWGVRSVPLLRQAAHSPDPEVATRARRCLSLSLKQPSPEQLIQTLHRLENSPDPDALPILLNYLPYAGSESVIEAAQAVIAHTGFTGGRPRKALLDALSDSQPEKRAAAGVALCRGGGEKEQTAVRTLLADADAEVRLRVALALLPRGNRESLRTLANLLDILPPERAWPVLDTLSAAAGEQAPAIAPGTDRAGRRRCREAWLAWWNRYADRAAFPRAAQRPERGPTVVVRLHPYSTQGSIRQLRADGSPEWEMGDLDYPISAQVLPGRRALVVEYRARRVTERDRKGEVLWSREFDRPVVDARRLENGNTFLVFRNGLAELNREGEEVFNHRRPTREVVAARKLPGGGSVLLTQTGRCIFLDRDGRESGRIRTGVHQVLGAGFDVLPNRRVVIPDLTGNRVVEFAPDGSLLWQTAVKAPTSAQRLPHGITLIGSTATGEVMERDRVGNVLWKQELPPGLIRAWRR
jgi:PQQ-like domain